MNWMALVLLVLIPLRLTAQDNSTPTVLSLHEMSMDLSPHGINANSCISVFADGHFHIETRFQQLPQSYATLHIYEASLDDFHMQRLRNLLDSSDIRHLPHYTHPVTPMGASSISSVDVQIPREQVLQKIGYFMWDAQTAVPNQSPETTPKVIKEEWSAARIVLIPLVQWFREVEGMKWPEVPISHSTLCEVAATSQ